MPGAGSDRITIRGIKELQRALKRMDADLPKLLRVTFNEASALVINYAEARMPSVTGAARASLKARSSQREARVALGGRKAPYAPWLDFGGQGRVAGRPPARPFQREGRYVYAGLRAENDRITDMMDKALHDLITSSGLEEG
jgi:hypothetical protein